MEIEARPIKNGKVLTGCVLVPVLFFLAMFLIGFLALVLDSASGFDPVKGESWQPALLSAVFILFLGRIALGLIATLRGKSATLIPHVVQVVLALVLGLAGLGLGLAGLLGFVSLSGAASGLGTAPIFLAFAWREFSTRRRGGIVRDAA